MTSNTYVAGITIIHKSAATWSAPHTALSLLMHFQTTSQYSCMSTNGFGWAGIKYIWIWFESQLLFLMLLKISIFFQLNSNWFMIRRSVFDLSTFIKLVDVGIQMATTIPFIATVCFSFIIIKCVQYYYWGDTIACNIYILSSIW